MFHTYVPSQREKMYVPCVAATVVGVGGGGGGGDQTTEGLFFSNTRFTPVIFNNISLSTL